jgi:hypothetical protein
MVKQIRKKWISVEESNNASKKSDIDAIRCELMIWEQFHRASKKRIFERRKNSCGFTPIPIPSPICRRFSSFTEYCRNCPLSNGKEFGCGEYSYKSKAFDSLYYWIHYYDHGFSHNARSTRTQWWKRWRKYSALMVKRLRTILEKEERKNKQ